MCLLHFDPLQRYCRQQRPIPPVIPGCHHWQQRLREEEYLPIWSWLSGRPWLRVRRTRSQRQGYQRTTGLQWPEHHQRYAMVARWIFRRLSLRSGLHHPQHLCQGTWWTLLQCHLHVLADTRQHRRANVHFLYSILGPILCRQRRQQ